MAKFYQVPRNYPGPRARSRARSRTRGGCRCPSGARMLSTGGRGRGFVCQSTSFKKIHKRRRTWVLKPFVKALCG